MKRSFAACSLASLLLLPAGPAPAAPASLTVLIWQSYISPAVVARWKARTGSDLNQIYFDSGDKRDAILSAASAGVDLTVVDEARIGTLGRRGLLADLGKAALANLSEVAPRWRRACGRYGVPYFWGLDGILYRTDKVARAPRSWNDLLRPDPALAGHISMFRDDDDVLAAPLSLLGKASNTDDADDLRRAFALLKAQAPSVLTYDYVVTAQQRPELRDRVYMAMGFTGDQNLLNRDPAAHGAWRFVAPDEGSMIWVDCITALDRSPHRDLALRFIDFLNEPRTAADNAADLGVPTANDGALPLLPAALRDDPGTYPDAGVLARSQLRGPVSAETQQLRRRMVGTLARSHDAQ